MICCVIIPVYNEEKFLTVFLESLVAQTTLPSKVICVDDNSTDSSADIIQEFSNRYPFIEYLFHKSGDFKVQGKKVINAFNFGLQRVDLNSYDIISKIDSDLELPYNYFEKVIKVFESDEKVGIAGGRIVEMQNGIWGSTVQADYHIRGALKSYRKICFNDIGGLKSVLGWDGLDEMTAMYMGWKTKIVESEVKHFRPAASDYGRLDLAYKIGESNYLNGGNLFLALVRFFIRLIRFQDVSYPTAFMKGYLSLYRKKASRNVTKELASFINSFHLKRIFKLK